MRQRAAQMWGKPLDEVAYAEGQAYCTSDATLRLYFREIAAQAHAIGVPVAGRGAVNLTSVGPAVGSHICDIEVDTATGKATILRYTVIQDVGTAIHPSYVEGQLQGGAVQ